MTVSKHRKKTPEDLLYKYGELVRILRKVCEIWSGVVISHTGKEKKKKIKTRATHTYRLSHGILRIKFLG